MWVCACVCTCVACVCVCVDTSDICQEHKICRTDPCGADRTKRPVGISLVGGHSQAQPKKLTFLKIREKEGEHS